MWILNSNVNPEQFPTFSSESYNMSMVKMQEFLSNGSFANHLKFGEIFGLLGVTASGYSYTMQYLVLLEEVVLTCGIEQLEMVNAVFPNLARPAGIIHATGDNTVQK